MRERRIPSSQEGWDCSKHDDYKESQISEMIGQKSTNSSRRPEHKVHDRRTESIMRHMILSGTDLLHHVEHVRDKSKTIEKLLDRDQ